MKTIYTVWVGGVEVHDYEIEDQGAAERLAAFWRAQDYDDVQIEAIEKEGE
jgi:hypothetical protein